MRKHLALLVATATLTLASCAPGGDTPITSVEPTSKPEESSSEIVLSTEKKIALVVKNFDVLNTSGYTYTLEQKVGTTVVNSHVVEFRVGYLNDVLVATREETSKTLNEDISESQYTLSEAEAAYRDGKVKSGDSDWKNCSFEEFAGVQIEGFHFDFPLVENVNASVAGKNALLTFSVPDNKASMFLGVSGDIKNLSFEVKTDSSFEKLSSLKMTYKQVETTTSFSFVPVYGSVSFHDF